jgi:hypothetical protein
MVEGYWKVRHSWEGNGHEIFRKELFIYARVFQVVSCVQILPLKLHMQFLFPIRATCPAHQRYTYDLLYQSTVTSHQHIVFSVRKAAVFSVVWVAVWIVYGSKLAACQIM